MFCLSPTTSSYMNLVNKNQFPKLHAYFDFFTINFTLWNHILNTGEVALKVGKFNTTKGWATLYKKHNKEQE